MTTPETEARTNPSELLATAAALAALAEVLADGDRQSRAVLPRATISPTQTRDV